MVESFLATNSIRLISVQETGTMLARKPYQGFSPLDDVDDARVRELNCENATQTSRRNPTLCAVTHIFAIPRWQMVGQHWALIYPQLRRNQRLESGDTELFCILSHTHCASR